MTVHTMETHSISSGTVSICPVCGGPIFSAFANKTMYTNTAAHSICLLEPDKLALNDFIKEITI